MPTPTCDADHKSASAKSYPQNSFGDRHSRAEAIVERGGIRIDGNAIMVPSSDGKREYAVRLIDGRVVCNCEDARRGHECKHQRAAALFVQQESKR